jgi:hypothetical protein
MNPLVKAIINSDIAAVRQIATTNKVLLTTKTDNDEYPIELAKKKGIHRIEVAIARQIDYQSFYTQAQLQKLLLNYISELSEEYYCASWLDSIEFQLWDLLQQQYEDIIKIDFWRKRVDKEELEDMRFLAEATNCWGIWDEEPEAIPIPLEQWISIRVGKPAINTNERNDKKRTPNTGFDRQLG